MKRNIFMQLVVLFLTIILSGCGKKQETQPIINDQTAVTDPQNPDQSETPPFTLKTDEITLECGPYCANDFNLEDYVIADDYSSLCLRIAGNQPKHCKEEDFAHPDTVGEFREVTSTDDLFPEYDPHLVIYDKNTGYFSTIRILFVDTTPPVVDTSYLNTTINLYGLSFMDTFGIEEPYIATWEDGNIYYNQFNLTKEYICPDFYRKDEDGNFVEPVYADYVTGSSISIYLENCKYVFLDYTQDSIYESQNISLTKEIFPGYGSYTDNLIFEDLYGNQTKVPVTINIIADFTPEVYDDLNDVMESTKQAFDNESVPFGSYLDKFILAAQAYKSDHPETENELINSLLNFAEEYLQ